MKKFMKGLLIFLFVSTFLGFNPAAADEPSTIRIDTSNRISAEAFQARLQDIDMQALREKYSSFNPEDFAGEFDVDAIREQMANFDINALVQKYAGTVNIDAIEEMIANIDPATIEDHLTNFDVERIEEMLANFDTDALMEHLVNIDLQAIRDGLASIDIQALMNPSGIDVAALRSQMANADINTLQNRYAMEDNDVDELRSRFTDRDRSEMPTVNADALRERLSRRNPPSRNTNANAFEPSADQAIFPMIQHATRKSRCDRSVKRDRYYYSRPSCNKCRPTSYDHRDRYTNNETPAWRDGVTEDNNNNNPSTDTPPANSVDVDTPQDSSNTSEAPSGAPSMKNIDMTALKNMFQNTMNNVDVAALRKMAENAMQNVDMAALREMAENAMQNIDMAALREMAENTMQHIDVEAMREMAENTIQHIDVEAMREMAQNTMQHIDVEAMREMAENTMQHIDVEAMREMAQNTMQHIDVEAMREMAQNAMQHIDVEALRERIADMQRLPDTTIAAQPVVTVPEDSVVQPETTISPSRARIEQLADNNDIDMASIERLAQRFGVNLDTIDLDATARQFGINDLDSVDLKSLAERFNIDI